MAIAYDKTLLDIVGKPPILRPVGFGITVTEYAAENKCTRNIAKMMLDRAVEAGVLKTEEMRLGKFHGLVYSRVEKGKK